MKNKIIVVALGGNAILQADERGTYEEQLNNVKRAVSEIIKLIKDGYKIALTHGNGPQVGNLYIQNSLAGEVVPPMPLDVCSAESQGLIGYFIQQEMQNELKKQGMAIPVVTFITQVLVSADDPAFKNPTKPIGPFHNKKEAQLLMQKTSFIMKEDSNHRWRRVVPSPQPIGIVEKEIIKSNIEKGYIVIASGGGGIPVVKKGQELVGVEAVIDKDLSACRLGLDIKANILLILTDVERVALNYNTPQQKWIDKMSVAEAKRYLAEGHFKEGSMKPKVEACLRFLENGGEKGIIGALFSASSAVKGLRGTTITK
ncbi:MAG: carbamate kinase [Candidatus Aminicenantales bacterium]